MFIYLLCATTENREVVPGHESTPSRVYIIIIMMTLLLNMLFSHCTRVRGCVRVTPRGWHRQTGRAKKKKTTNPHHMKHLYQYSKLRGVTHICEGRKMCRTVLVLILLQENLLNTVFLQVSNVLPECILYFNSLTNSIAHIISRG